MKQKIISLLLVLTLCMSLVISVSADTPVFVSDEFGNLANEEVAELNLLAYRLYEETGVGFFFVYTYEDPLEDYDLSIFTGGIEDYVIMMENETHWYMHLGGRGYEIDSATEDALRAVYNEADTYVGGVEAFLYAAADLFPAKTDAPAEDIFQEEAPQEDIPAEDVPVEDIPVEDAPEADEYFVYDDADLLSDSEEAALAERLEEISHAYDAQIVVCTLASMDGGDIEEFQHFLYDTMGFGYGENYDGVQLLVCMDPREYRILSNGYAGTAINSDDIDHIGNEIVSDLSDGNYADAFHSFADSCEHYLDGYINGYPFNVSKKLITCLIIGVIAGLIVVFVLKAQLKTVRKQEQATVYTKQGSMYISMRSDLFLYRNVTRTKKESSSSSGSGGSSRSTGGGKF